MLVRAAIVSGIYKVAVAGLETGGDLTTLVCACELEALEMCILSHLQRQSPWGQEEELPSSSCVDPAPCAGKLRRVQAFWGGGLHWQDGLRLTAFLKAPGEEGGGCHLAGRGWR